MREPQAFDAKDAVWSRPQLPDEDTGQYSWPADMRAEYERLTGRPEFDPNWEGQTMVNLVELLADPSEWATDTPCAWGHRVEGHAVYCHNDGWLYSQRKCRRRQDDPEWKHENCPGYRANPRLAPG